MQQALCRPLAETRWVTHIGELPECDTNAYGSASVIHHQKYSILAHRAVVPGSFRRLAANERPKQH